MIKSKVLKGILNSVCAVSISVVLLSTFAYVYSYDGIHITNITGATDYVWRPYEHVATMTEGITWLKMNGEGFNNGREYTGCSVLFMGSSHTDDLHFSTNKNASGLVAEGTGLSTYNIGMSGHTIYRCIDNYDNAIEYYKPDAYVVIETATIELSTAEMNNVISGTAQAIPSYETGALYYMQLIPAFKPIVNQLDTWITNEVLVTSNSATVAVPDNYYSTLCTFLSIIKEITIDTGICPIIYYHPPEKLLYDGTISYKTNSEYLSLFKDACEENDIIFLDMTETFQKAYYSNHQLAHGFCNTQLGKGHLNEYGHQLVAQEIIDVILERRGK